MSEIVFHHNVLILDASPLICLYASGQMESILSTIPKTVSVAAYVKNTEAKHIYNQTFEGVENPYELINLGSFISKGLLTITDVETEDEANTVLDLVQVLGQGEAISGAIAAHRDWAIGVDDKKARRIFLERMPQLQLLSTLDLVRHWQTVTNAPSTMTRSVLLNISDRARYRPENNHPHHEWWEAIINQN